MRKIQNEEFISEEVTNIQEFLDFSAEEYIVNENIRNNFESYKVEEVNLAQENQSKPSKKNLLDKFNKLKTSMNSISTTISSVAAAVVAVGIGAISILPPIVEEINYGKVELINYYIDYNFENSELQNNIRFYFDIELDDGYYALLKNQQSMEEKEVNYKYVNFENIGEDNLTFELSIIDEDNKIIDSSIIHVNPNSENEFLGSYDVDYNILENEDSTYNLSLIIDELSDPVEAYLTDIDGKYLDYACSYKENVVEFLNIKETKFNIFIGSYYIENDNCYLKSSYYIDNFNALKPSDINLMRVEVLNESYNDYENGIPTYLYFDGYLTAKDYAEVIVYDSSNNELQNITNINDLSKPCVFYNLPTDDNLTFSYKVHNSSGMVEEETHQVSLEIKDEYKYASYDFIASNPGECLITFNDDGTYNCYVYTNFLNNSEYDVTYKMELARGFEPVYEYIGTDKVAAFKNVNFEESYSLIYKVFLKDGINYYAIKDFYMMSGTVGEGIKEEGYSNPHFYVDSSENKKYNITSYEYIEGDVNVEILLSNNQKLEYVYPSDQINEGVILDLTSYEFDTIYIKIVANCNPYYGLGDLILDTGFVVEGKMTKQVEYEYSE